MVRDTFKKLYSVFCITKKHLLGSKSDTTCFLRAYFEE